jgi:hypothetical protein
MAKRTELSIGNDESDAIESVSLNVPDQSGEKQVIDQEQIARRPTAGMSPASGRTVTTLTTGSKRSGNCASGRTVRRRDESRHARSAAK